MLCNQQQTGLSGGCSYEGCGQVPLITPYNDRATIFVIPPSGHALISGPPVEVTPVHT